MWPAYAPDAEGLNPGRGVVAIGIHKENLGAQTFIECGGQIADLVDERAVAAGSDHHDRPAGSVLFFELPDALLCAVRTAGEVGDESGPGRHGGHRVIPDAPAEIIQAENQHDRDGQF